MSVQNTDTEYIGPIPGALQDGMSIIIIGKTEQQTGQFVVSIMSGTKLDDVLFWFNPRFTENEVVRNTLRNGIGWGTEERQGGFPFEKDHRYEITIHVTYTHFNVSVDGRHFCDYIHRLPKHMATHIMLRHFSLQSIRFKVDQENDASSRIQSNSSVSFPTPYPVPQLIYNPHVPFMHNAGKLYPNKMFIISGILKPIPKRMTFDFETSDTDEIAFHFDVRYNYGDSKIVVRNTRRLEGWGIEERDLPFFPFQPDKFFEVMVLVDFRCFKVAVNNQHLLEYRHRLEPLSRVDTLRITGDVRLTQVRF